ncbi:MAG: T9SS type A sorting domain-containing protein [Bacteroidales bacterium]|nr:T9SS type A sorting domain-containing protein [Bacteroidales bacterium]
MKKILLIAGAMVLIMMGYAQETITTTGGEATGNAGSVSYTIGQIAVQTAANGNASIAEGVQQPYEIQTVGVDNYPQITLDAKVYPNPTADKLTLTVNNGVEKYGRKSLQVALFNNNGQYLRTLQVAGVQTDIDMTDLSSGTYYLRVTDGNQTLKTFKIIKTM